MSCGLEGLSNRWSDWRVDRWERDSLLLIADNDLTYHHSVEVAFHSVAYVAVPAEFSHPVFRDAAATEVARVRAALDGGLGDLSLFAWDSDAEEPGRACLVAAASVSVTEGLVLHGPVFG